MPQEFILVCAGKDGPRAQKSGLPRLHLSLGLRPDGGPRPPALPRAGRAGR